MSEALCAATYGVEGLEGHGSATDFQVGYVGGMGEHPEAWGGCRVERSRMAGKLLKESWDEMVGCPPSRTAGHIPRDAEGELPMGRCRAM